MSDQKKLEGLMTTLIETLVEAVKNPECGAPILNVARQLLKDQGVEVRRTKSNPLGSLADALPTFDQDDAEELPHTH
jgi:hypothetical protein